MTLFFLHIPKSAGTTLRQVFERQFDEQDIYRTYTDTPVEGDGYRRQADQERYRLVIGHFLFGIHAGCVNPCSYATMLRHPVKQVISHYNHFARSDNPIQRQVMSRLPDLASFSQSNWSRHFLIRRLTGAAIDAIQREPEKHLHAARENLQREFSWVGVMERFEESMLLLGDTFGWTDLQYRAENITAPGQRSSRDLTRTEKESLEEATACDVAVYRFAEEMLNERLSQVPDLQQRLRAAKMKINSHHQSKRSVFHCLRDIVHRRRKPDGDVSGRE